MCVVWALADIDPEWGEENCQTNTLIRRGICSKTPQGEEWETVDAADKQSPVHIMSQISAGPCGLVWAIDAQYGVWCRRGVSQSTPAGTVQSLDDV